jgi:hypothetical protein
MLTGTMSIFSADYTNNFNKQAESHTNGFDYDYGSIMQYPKWAFAIDGSIDTIKSLKQTSLVLGQRDKISDLDLAELNYLYNCQGSTAQVSSNTWNLVKGK